MDQRHLFYFQGPQVVFNTYAQIFGFVIRYPALIGLSGGAYLCADHQIMRIGVQGLGDQAVGYVFSIIVGSI